MNQYGVFKRAHISKKEFSEVCKICYSESKGVLFTIKSEDYEKWLDYSYTTLYFSKFHFSGPGSILFEFPSNNLNLKIKKFKHSTLIRLPTENGKGTNKIILFYTHDFFNV